MELRHLKYFIQVAESLNYRKAAEQLHIAQPGLSRQISQLEKDIGALLLKRDKRSVQLTPAGKYLLSESKFILNHLNAVVHQLQQIERGYSGEIRIGYVGSAMQTVLPSILQELHERFPDITSALSEMNNQDQLEQVGNDQLDIGFVRLQAVPEHISMQPLHIDSFSVVLPATHPLETASFHSIDQLANEEFIMFSSDYSPHYYEKIISICEDRGFHPKISHRSVHAYTIFKLVASGLGIAIIPTSLKIGYDLNVKFLEIPNIRQQTTLSAIWSEKSRNPVLPVFTQILKTKKPDL